MSVLSRRYDNCFLKGNTTEMAVRKSCWACLQSKQKRKRRKSETNNSEKGEKVLKMRLKASDGKALVCSFVQILFQGVQVHSPLLCELFWGPSVAAVLLGWFGFLVLILLLACSSELFRLSRDSALSQGIRLGFPRGLTGLADVAHAWLMQPAAGIGSLGWYGRPGEDRWARSFSGLRANLGKGGLFSRDQL